ncbi:MAG: DNA adenine methylase [Patescibacteria group bacterium]
MKKEVPGFVKWAGGKKQLLEQFKKYFPKTINNYYEPFAGGGAVAFFIIKNYSPKEVLISDINEELINAYEAIRGNLNELLELLKHHKNAHSKENYYKIRELQPEKLNKIERAARFIYLNKSCFNGLYRVNSIGRFNVPIGSSKHPAILMEEDLREISRLLQNVKIKMMPFEEITNYTRRGDFIYLDPPYYPLKKGKSFTTYTKEAFLEKEQEKLSEVFKALDRKGCKVMLSNSNTEFIRKLYEGYNIGAVRASRMINCDATRRGKIKELVITNYDKEGASQLTFQSGSLLKR